jgi:hypothetical protein
MNQWPDELVAEFRRLRGLGLSHGECGKRIGKSRSACTAKWDRITGRFEKRNGPRKRCKPTARQSWDEAALTETWAERKARRLALRSFG